MSERVVAKLKQDTAHIKHTIILAFRAFDSSKEAFFNFLTAGVREER